MKTLKKRMLCLICVTALTASAIPASSASAVDVNDVSKLSAQEICQQMGIGWNLGNSLDATKCSGLESETSWGNPKTTKAMIDAVKDEGFTCVRIPTTWFNHMDGNYTVDGQWMARVKEVVDYCIDDGLYVILNSHHEQWNRPTESNYPSASFELKSLWTQIANEFEDYDRHLIFEGMNEPRNYDGEHEWDGGNTEMRNIINKLNQDFVDTVRSTGGNNTNRCLMIPTYAASAEYAAMADLKIPDDDNIIVSIHSYSPYSFAFDSSGTSQFTDDMAAQLDSIFKNFSNLFVVNKIPVCIGEFSATNKGNSAERAKWAAYYAKKAKELGISCMLWDNNCYGPGGSESHGYLNRSSCTWYDKSIVDSLVNSYKNTQTNIPKPVEVPDLSKAKITVLSDQQMTASGYSPTAGVQFNFPSMKEGSVIAMNYSGSAVPTLVVQDNRQWQVWAQVAPFAAKDSVAYYSYQDIVTIYAAAYKGAYGEEPASPLYQAFQLFATGSGSDITVNKIVYAEFDENTDKKTDINSCTVTLREAAEFTGLSIKPTVKVKDGTTTLKNGRDYTVTYSDNKQVGTATVTITGKGNYEGTVVKTFKIIKKSVDTCDVTLSKTSASFNNTAIKPEVTVKIGDEVINSRNYDVKYTNNVKAGKATVTITGKNNLKGKVTKTFRISARSLSKCKISLSGTSFKYTGSAIEPKVTVGVTGSDIPVDSSNYTVTYTNNVNKGTATVTITGKGSLKDSVTKTFTIK